MSKPKTKGICTRCENKKKKLIYPNTSFCYSCVWKEKWGEQYWLRAKQPKYRKPKKTKVCALCKKEKGVVLDHDHSKPCHKPGHAGCRFCIRAWLCRACNVGLGVFQDDPETLREAALYVEKWKER